MIASLRGTVLSATPLHAVIEVAGIGYEVHVPVTTAGRLPANGEQALLHTVVVYREDSQTIYGFASAAERDFFRLLIEKVNGVGPKVALALMSHFALADLQSAIASSNAEALSKCVGVGRKTAERIILDLKDRIGAGGVISAMPALSPALASQGAGGAADAMAALIALGYKAPEAEKAIAKAVQALGVNASTEALIKKALG